MASTVRSSHPRLRFYGTSLSETANASFSVSVSDQGVGLYSGAHQHGLSPVVLCSGRFSCTSYVELQQFAVRWIVLGVGRACALTIDSSQWLFYFSLSMIFAADLLIAASMCALLARRRSTYFGYVKRRAAPFRWSMLTSRRTLSAWTKPFVPSSCSA